MGSHLIDSLATTDALAKEFSDVALLQSMLSFEVGLARAQARLGLVPQAAADAIAAAASAADFDAAVIARDARESGTVAIPFVKALTERVRGVDAASAGFVHWGATSQDVADTALVLAIRSAHGPLAADHGRLLRALADLSHRHAGTVMLGRTLLQPAPPTTFGLKAAGWWAALVRSWSALENATRETLVLQFGGASGTLASQGPHGLALSRALADELGLTNPDAPWHAHRDRLGTLVASHGVYTATLGKMARDISLLMQHEVGEAAEPGGESSTMPQKRNPAGCAIALAAATRMPGLVAAFLAGMVQEHERSVGGWQAEWPTLASVIQSSGAALAAMADAVGGLAVSDDRMRANIEKTNGAIFAERVMMLAAPSLGRDVADRLVRAAVERSRLTGQRLGDVVAATPELQRALRAGDCRDLDRPEDYLGMAEAFRQQLLASSSAHRTV